MHNNFLFLFLLCFVSYAEWNIIPKEKTKKLSLNSTKPVQKIFATTNEVTIIEGLPFVLQSNLSGTNFIWQKDGNILKSETNNFLTIDYSLEGDAGQYTLKTGKEIVIFNVSFKRTIKIFINDQEIENFNNSNGHAETTDGSIIRLVPFIEGLPIRYTLDEIGRAHV